MKKYIIIIFIIIFALLLLTSCNKNVEQSIDPPQTDEPADDTEPVDIIEPPEPPEPPEETPAETLANELSFLWDKIDGSTATIPLTTAMYNYFGEAGNPPEHNTTSDAYNNLFWGNADLIFVTYPSEGELAEAQRRGIELDIIPVTKDALVFLVNSENPVENITLDQLRDIYTGKITNWKELGGLDEDIVPYQRTENSGSQTLLLKLVMDGAEPMNPPFELIAESMGALVDVVSSYDNARNAIGYSMFYYVNNMYGNDRFKLLSIDGVKPSRDTIIGGEYTLGDGYYAVLRKDKPESSYSRKLIEWLLTDEGQAVAVQAGYIPLREITGVLPDDTIDPIYLGDVNNSSGTGGTELKSTDEIKNLVVNGVRKPLSDLFYDGFNYIEYINIEIITSLQNYPYAYYYPDSYEEHYTKRPFTGIPNNYPNYELTTYRGRDDTTDVNYIRIILPEDNPFFSEGMSFHIRLTSDISPYGIANNFAVKYNYDRRMSPNVDLYTLTVKLPEAPEIAEIINKKLIKWTDSFPISDDKAEFIDMYIKWRIGFWGLDSSEYAYNLQPFYGRWNNYLSVSYILEDFGGPTTYFPMLFTICFDMNTGKIVDLAKLLPDDIPYSESIITNPVKEFKIDEYPTDTVYEDYIPAEGSVITSAWISGYTLGLYITEPDGRELKVTNYSWNYNFQG